MVSVGRTRSGGVWVRRRCGLMAAAALALLVGAGAAAAQDDAGFPFEQELVFAGAPMAGTRQIPNLEIDRQGRLSLLMWCNTLMAQAVVTDGRITILPGATTRKACPPEVMKADDDLIAALQQAAVWQREGNLVTIAGEAGASPLRFRLPTN